jgi:hypothetical protein
MWSVKYLTTPHGACSLIKLKIPIVVTVTLLSLLLPSKVMQQLVSVSGMYGMVTPREKMCLLHPVVGRFHTGDTIRVVQPAEVIGQVPWVLEGNKSCGLRVAYDVRSGKSLGTFTVRVCWRTAIYRDEVGFDENHFMH